jgi:uncharacterized membrane protein YdfJ with MMPL/SSD domain
VGHTVMGAAGQPGRGSTLPQTQKRRSLAARAGRWSSEHRRVAIIGWLVFAVTAAVIGFAIGARSMSSSDYATGESAVAERILARDFPQHAAESVFVHNPAATVRESGFRAAVAAVVARLGILRDVTGVQSPLGSGGGRLVSRDGHSALVQFEIAGNSDEAAGKVVPVQSAVSALARSRPGFVIEEFGAASGNRALNDTIAQDLQRAGYLSLPVTLAILLVAFGAVVAAGIPVLLALSGVLGTLGLAALVSRVVPEGSPTASVIFMIGMAVGVDYSLFYLRREREERAAGREPVAALRAAAATSGQAVLVSGATVVIAMTGMLFTGANVFTSIGVGTMLVVLVAMVGSVTVLPAALAALGSRVERGRLPLIGRRTRMSGESRVWGKILTPVLARPLASAAAAVVLLVLLALPAFRLHTELLGFTSLPGDTPIVKTYQRVQNAFPGASLPSSVVIKAQDVDSPEAQARIAALENQATATGKMPGPVAVRTNHARTVAVVDIPLTGNSHDAASFRALDTLRQRVVPTTVAKIPGGTVAVTGETAGTVDFNDTIRSRIAVVFGFVIGLAFLLLLVTFRSIVIPLKAVVLNLLSVGAAYGILVAVFQYGWGASLIGAHATGAITSWLPLFLFVILFGLSMDYHVFILSRVKELVDQGMPTRVAVQRGIRTTAGTVTSAAFVMVAVFAIFITGHTPDLKQMGLGLAVAVLLDATVIRGVLLPATMELFGEWNWYLPRRLERLLGTRSAAPVDPS